MSWAREKCPHLAMLLRSMQEVHIAQASFYGLGLRRNGWILHRSILDCSRPTAKACEVPGSMSTRLSARDAW